MERIDLKKQTVTHYEILKRIETRCYDRLESIHREIDDLKRDIRNLEDLSRYENEDLEKCQTEMAQIDAECDALEKAGSHFETVELVRTKEGHEYYVIQYETDQLFSFGYIHSGTFHICPAQWESQDEAFKAVSKRELSLSLGETVMF